MCSLQKEKGEVSPIQYLGHQSVLPIQNQLEILFARWTAGRSARPCHSQNQSRCCKGSDVLLKQSNIIKILELSCIWRRIKDSKSRTFPRGRCAYIPGATVYGTFPIPGGEKMRRGREVFNTSYWLKNRSASENLPIALTQGPSTHGAPANWSVFSGITMTSFFFRKSAIWIHSRSPIGGFFGARFLYFPSQTQICRGSRK